MKTKNNIRFALLFLFVISIQPFVYAQSEEDSVYNSLPYHVMADSIYGTLNPDSIPYGILIEKAYPTIDIEDYDGLLTNENTLSHDGWRRVYGTIRRAFVNQANAYDSLGEVIDTMEAYVNRGLIPVTVFNYTYATIRTDAVTENLLSIGEDGWQLFDVPGRTQSPYQTKRCFAAATGVLSTETHEVTFIFPQQLYFTNDTRVVDHLEVDFGDGEGYRLVHFDEEILISYESDIDANPDQFINLKLKLVFSTNELLAATASLTVSNGYSLHSGEYTTILADEIYERDTVRGVARVSITYGCGNGGKLMKPLIFIEGVDNLAGIMTGDNKPNKKGDRFIKAISAKNPALISVLTNQGYDIVTVDFENNSGNYVQQSAYTLETVIKKLNEEKRANHSTHKNVILGVSMGGLTAHYALSHMTKNNVDHDTKLFISFDSPHRGANYPIGLQAMIRDVYDVFILNKVDTPEMGRLYWDYRMLESKAGKQMLISTYGCSNCLSEHQNFLNELDALDQPNKTGCRTIAIANGSFLGTTSRQCTINGNTTGIPNGTLYAALSSTTRYFLINTSPDITQGSKLIFQGVFSNFSIPHGKKISHHFRNRYINANSLNNGLGSLDLAQGSAASTLESRASSLEFLMNSGSTNTISYSCFIPTYSALNMKGVHPEADLSSPAALSSTTFDRLIVSQETSQPFNEGHVKLTTLNTSVLWELAATTPSILTPPFNFNYGNNTDDRLGSIQVNNGSTLSINKNMPTGLTPSTTSGPAPKDNSLFNVHTNVISTCITTPTVIVIESGGILELGDAASNRSGELHLRNGSKLILKDGAILKLYNASRLIVYQGATLEIAPTASLFLDGTSSVIQINGKLKLLNNTTFKLAANSNGYVQFGSVGNTSSIQVESGINCKIELTGNSRTTRKLLEINGTLTPESNPLTLLKLEGGYVELGEDASMATSSPVHLENVAFKKLPFYLDTFIHNGILLNGQDENNIYIRHCDFSNAKIAITRIGSNSSSPALEIGDCLFSGCSRGIYSTGKGIRLKYVKFIYCNIGWQAENMTSASDFLGIVQHGSKGIEYSGYGNLFIYNSSFEEITNIAVKVEGVGICAIKCSDFSGNYKDIVKNFGVLNLSTTESYTRLNNTIDYGGKNRFNNTQNTCITVSELATLYLENGQNHFTFASGNPTQVVSGSLHIVNGQTQLNTTDNYWQIYVQGILTNQPALITLTKAGIPIGQVNNYNMNFGNIGCDRWDGSRIDDNDWALFGKRSLNNALDLDKTTQQIKVLVYPNPVESRLSMMISNTVITKEQVTVKVIDQLGKHIALKQLPPEGTNETVAYDWSDLSPGIYQVTVELHGNIVHQQKLIKRQ